MKMSNRENLDDTSATQKEINPYSRKYRILKTLVLVISWLSFGIMK